MRASVDATPEARDAAPRVVALINPAQQAVLADGYARFVERHGNRIALCIYAIQDVDDSAVAARIREELRSADLVLLDIRGGGKAATLVESALEESSQPVVVLAGGSPELMRLVRLGSFSFAPIAQGMQRKQAEGKSGPFNLRRLERMLGRFERLGTWLPFGRLKHARNWVRATTYWKMGGEENAQRLLALLGREYLKLRLPSPKPPHVFPPIGICDPETEHRYADAASYFASRPPVADKPVVGLLIYGGMHFAQSLAPARSVAAALRAREIEVLPVFSDAGHNLEAVRTFFAPNGQPSVSAAIYFQWFQLATFAEDEAEDVGELLRQCGVPWFNAAPMYGSKIEDWAKRIDGVSPVEALTAIILPEVDGMIEPLPTAGLAEREATGPSTTTLHEVVAIPEQAKRLAQRVAQWSALQRKPNADKRVALILYDNPPGEDNLGNAAYLDVFESVRRILIRLAAEGYDAGEIPEAGEIHEHFLGSGLVNSGRWSVQALAAQAGQTLDAQTYASWLAELPEADSVLDAWGAPPGNVMVHGGRFLLPIRMYGNVAVGIQPARGYHGDPDKLTHDKTLPPNHQYIAFYQWLERTWACDAMVHIGTHGTLEFLQGKEMGMGPTCWPALLASGMPHLYVYHVVNASEASIAKRRSLGTLVNYNSPSFASSELYGEYATLAERIEEWAEAKAIEPARAQRVEAAIRALAGELNLDAAAPIDELQEELALMQRSLIPKGLHVLGEDVSFDGQADFATFLLRKDRGKHLSLHRELAEARGVDYPDLLKRGGSVFEEIENEVRNRVCMGLRGELNGSAKDSLNEAVHTARLLTGRGEMDALLEGLNGRFVPPGPGGDPLRNPEVLPTGRNTYQFDPRLVPSELACERGAAIARNTLEAYRAEHGAYPRNTAVILWGFETTKTRGETVGQVLAYLGVRIARDSSPWYKKLEVVPLEELGRPRVDCHIQICGFFRDMYPNVLELMNRAFALVAALDESGEANAVRTHTAALAETLSAEMPAEEARKLAEARVYGPRPGEYGTRTTGLIETGAWQDEAEITDMYTASMSHVYADGAHGVRLPTAYNERLRKVDLVSQVRDCHEYEIVDLDHYYEFFGGLARTVESVRGTAPAMMISDTAKEQIRTEPVKEALNRGVRTRLLNPKWIDGLLEHAYHGAQHIGDRVENLVGFAATTHAVDGWVWTAVNDCYVRDKERFHQMTENNRFATEELMKRLFEANDRGYWEATEEELELLKQRYLELEGSIEERIA